MEKMVLNETPIRTSKNFNINNVVVENVDNKENLEVFKNIKIKNESSKILVNNNSNVKNNFIYGVSSDIVNLVNNNSNASYDIVIDSKTNKEVFFEFEFDKNNTCLYDNFNIKANNNTSATIYFKYKSFDDNCYTHYMNLNVLLEENSNINIVFVNLLNNNSNSFVSFESKVLQNAKLNYNIIDFGGMNSISNSYYDLIGDDCKCSVNAIYLGNENQKYDMNYIAHLKGKKVSFELNSDGALEDFAKKSFKGTIDFIKGSKKSIGNEQDMCMLLSKNAKSISLPMLLCKEEEVEGNHSSSAGNVSNKDLFYIMSRGFSKIEAIKLLVRAKFEKTLQKIKDDKIKEEIIEKIEEKLN